MRFLDSQKLVQGKQHRTIPLDYGLNYLQQHLLATCLHPEPKTVLVLGLGVGAIPQLCRALYPNIELTIIELNPAVIEAAKTCFSFEGSTRCQVLCSDANDWLNMYEGPPFDIIFNDCFDGLLESVPMRSVSAIHRLASHLSKSGLLITNLLAHQNIPHSEWVETELLHNWVWSAHLKSNMSYILSRYPLDWSHLEKRAIRIDQLAILPFSLRSEVNRLKLQI